MKKYKIIYADPPWSWKTYSKKGRKKTSDKHYPLMDINDLYELKVSSITDENCLLFMWVQDAHLKNGINLGEHWGFKYSTIAFVWDKQNFGLGYFTRKGAEICLLFKKGSVKRINGGIRQFISEKSKIHSKKPDEVRKRITKLLGDIPRIELFAREKVEGWDCWGNEVDSDINLNENKKI